MKRFGYFVRLGGDKEISEALARGASGAMQPIQGASSEAVRRVAMMKHTPAEWREMTLDARRRYRRNKPLTGVRRALLTGYGLICYGISRLYHAQEGLLGRCGR